MKNKINELLARTRNPFEIQQLTGAKLSEIRAVMKEAPSALPGWGKPSLQRYIISRRKAYAPEWPVEDAKVIIEHKRMHDQGRVILCQGRDGEYIIQYAIPTKRPLRTTPYFYGGWTC